MKLIIAADHAGFATKEYIKKKMPEVEFTDVSQTLKEGDDYPDVAKKAAKKVLTTEQKGIIVCGSGVGVAIAANKIKGIRAAQVFNKQQTKLAVEHNNVNIITLPGRGFKKSDTIQIIKQFIKAKPSQETRHKRRIRKISKLEQ